MSAAARVVYLLRTFPELTETFVFREIRALRARGVPVTVLAVGRGGGADLALPLDGLEVGYLSPRPGPVPGLLRDLGGLRGWRRRARALRLAALARGAARLLPGDTAVLHAHFANDAGTLARYTGALRGLPYRLTTHAYDLYQDPFLLFENLRGATRILTISQDNLRWLRGQSLEQGFDPGRVSVLRCGLDLGEYPYRDPRPPQVPPRIVCVARLVEKKGHAVLLAAVERLGSARLDLVGAGPLHAALEVQARKLCPAIDVRVHGGLSPDATREIVRAADVLALAARVAPDGDRDGLPVALIEAAALGVPMVATAVSGIPELVDGAVGHLVPPDDPQALAAALRASLQAPQAERVARARRARERAEAEYDVNRLVQVLVP